MTEKMTEIGSLSMRQEGDTWSAYYSSDNAPDNDILLGSILIVLVRDSPERKKVFFNLMRDCLEGTIKECL